MGNFLYISKKKNGTDGIDSIPIKQTSEFVCARHEILCQGTELDLGGKYLEILEIFTKKKKVSLL